jgi:hypothetical protein
MKIISDGLAKLRQVSRVLPITLLCSGIAFVQDSSPTQLRRFVDQQVGEIEKLMVPRATPICRRGLLMGTQTRDSRQLKPSAFLERCCGARGPIADDLNLVLPRTVRGRIAWWVPNAGSSPWTQRLGLIPRKGSFPSRSKHERAAAVYARAAIEGKSRTIATSSRYPCRTTMILEELQPTHSGKRQNSMLLVFASADPTKQAPASVYVRQDRNVSEDRSEPSQPLRCRRDYQNGNRRRDT